MIFRKGPSFSLNVWHRVFEVPWGPLLVLSSIMQPCAFYILLLIKIFTISYPFLSDELECCYLFVHPLKKAGRVFFARRKDNVSRLKFSLFMSVWLWMHSVTQVNSLAVFVCCSFSLPSKFKFLSLMKRLAIVCRLKHLRGLSELTIALRFTRQRLAANCVVMMNVRICFSCFLLDAFLVRWEMWKKFNS